MNEKTRAAMFCTILAATTGGWASTTYEEARKPVDAAMPQRTAAATGATEKITVDEKPESAEYRDILMHSAVPKGYPRPVSDW